MTAISKKTFENNFVKFFRGDTSGDLHPRQTPGMFYSKAAPSPVAAPQLLGWSDNLAEELQMASPTAQDIAILAGNKITPSMFPYAACYAGHQFGNWAGQLGDGRAITLGEWRVENALFELQLKGAGPTAYSRRADGRAVLRSSVREFLISEAMHHLGVPTTRALSLVSTGEKVLRDVMYDGNPAYEPGAVVARVAPSFLRFGSFELMAAQREKEQLQQLVNWTIDHYYSHLTEENRILLWFQEVVENTAFLMTEWQRVGFVHGVMNTDNMSILGLTIDYGPFSFLDNYDHNFTPNTTDLPGKRYAFGNQASIAYWNLGRLANAISLLFEETDELEAVLATYEPVFWNHYYAMMGRKLGFDKVEKQEKELIAEFEKLLSSLQPDMTIFYRLLADYPQKLSQKKTIEYFKPSFYTNLQELQEKEFSAVLNKYAARIATNTISFDQARTVMNKANPRIILRNYQLHEAITALEKGENAAFLELQEAAKNPYADAGFEELVAKKPKWAENTIGCSMLSCSS